MATFNKLLPLGYHPQFVPHIIAGQHTGGQLYFRGEDVEAAHRRAVEQGVGTTQRLHFGARTVRLVERAADGLGSFSLLGSLPGCRWLGRRLAVRFPMGRGRALHIFARQECKGLVEVGALTTSRPRLDGNVPLRFWADWTAKPVGSFFMEATQHGPRIHNQSSYCGAFAEFLLIALWRHARAS